MASAVASNSKGVPMTVFLKKLLAEPSGANGAGCYALNPSSAASARRLFNFGGSPFGRYNDDDDEEESSDSDDDDDHRRRARNFSSPMFFSSADLVDPFGAPTTLGGLLSKMKDMVEASPAAKARRGSLALAPRGWWVAKQDKDAVTLMVPMPGLGKEHVKVWADQNTLVIKGEGDKKPADGDGDKKPADGDGDGGYELSYSRRIELPADSFKMDKIRAEMKNGLLKVTVLKVKEEERKDVFHVTVE